MQLQRYQKKLSGLIADRIDIHIQVPHQTYDILTSDKVGARDIAPLDERSTPCYHIG